jgi:FkbH-like protein
MKLLEALDIIRKRPREGTKPFVVALVCGFTPLHLQTFLHAWLLNSLPDSQIELQTGLYGDFSGNLSRIESQNPDAAIVVMEWGDLDPRLGLRNLGNWTPSSLDDIVEGVRSRLSQIQESIAHIAGTIPLAICFPTLPLPPIAYTPGTRTSSFQTSLCAQIAVAAEKIATLRNVGILNSQRLAELSPLSTRLDVRAELTSGFPYKMPYASVLAGQFARVLLPPTPKKGLISDLDDTMWSGILGEVGAEGVNWDLDHNSHMHAVYQKLLHSLSEAGVLLAIASKNDAKIVEQALQRTDLLLPAKKIFPVEANWSPKSQSVSRILKAWNVGDDSVVFVDDSPMELAEVQAAHPGVECILFPKDDPQAIDALLGRLRDLFGKNALSEEDSIRMESIRNAKATRTDDDPPGVASDEFLKQAQAEITFQFSKDVLDPRALELVNKTNQFNLNGKRYTEREWSEFVQKPNSLLLVVSYKDKYGPLGKIAVLAGSLKAKSLHLPVWVMSCRAFSRRIEYRCLEDLFSRFALEKIVFDFVATPKNGPARDFLKSVLGHKPEPGSTLTAGDFRARKLQTYQSILELTTG